MKTQRLEKIGEGRWSVVEDAMAPRYTALVLIVLLLGYWLVGVME